MKKSATFSFFLIFVSIFLSSCLTTKLTYEQEAEPSSSPEAVEFNETWGYVMHEKEKDYSPSLPLTDIGYFMNAVTTFSEIPPVASKNKYFSNTSARVHLVTSCDSKSQTHLLLDPNLPLKNKIIAQLIDATQSYDGLQVDWEYVPSGDANNFYEFLQILKSKLRGKPLSIAIPARIKTLEKDAYNYDKLAQIADKIIIMAYDQHWSTSAPGPIAGTDWCKRVAEYSSAHIPQDKLIMGLSFYGRAWRDDTTGGKAYTFKTLKEVASENPIYDYQRDEFDTPSFKIKKNLVITTWFDDAKSLRTRSRMYADLGVKGVSFWRVGQEDPAYWQYLKVKQEDSN